MTNVAHPSVEAALEAIRRGYQPIPIRGGDKIPAIPSWTRTQWENSPDGLRTARSQFEKWADDGATNVGLLLGEASGGLIDIDIDHPKAFGLRRHFLPTTPMRSGRAGRYDSHYWYVAEPGTLPTYREFLMPKTEEGQKGGVIVEFRSDAKHQTVIPPSIHPSGEPYQWTNAPWGGKQGPAVVHGRKLLVQTATLALATVLLDRWPTKGSRHEAYLALAGGLLWFGQNNVHPFWGDRGNAEVLIRAIAEASHDDDGPDARVTEVMGTTLQKIRDGEKTIGFGKLEDIIGDRYVKQARLLIGEIEQAAGFVSRQTDGFIEPPKNLDEALKDQAQEIAALAPEERNPMEERYLVPGGSWQVVDLEPYFAGRVQQVMPSLFKRSDGQHLMYPGRVNMLYGSSESAKSWLALVISLQEMSNGERVLYLDFEDEPVNTLSRLDLLGAGVDDLRNQFTYLRPEEPIAPMQRNRWGKDESTDSGKAAQELFQRQLESIDPTLIVADGMTVLYSLHGLNSNDSVDTEVITGWLKRLTRNGRSTVIVIDHTSKGAERGALPIGSQHKVSMVMGALLQVWAVNQPKPGSLGKLEIYVLKDRPGQVRAVSQESGGKKAQLAAEIMMDSRTPGAVAMTIDPPAGWSPGNPQITIDLTTSTAVQKAQDRAEAAAVILWQFKGQLGRRLTLDDLAVNTGWRRGEIEKVLLRLGAGSPAQIKKAAESPRSAALVGVHGQWLKRIPNSGPRVSSRGPAPATYELLIGGCGFEEDTSNPSIVGGSAWLPDDWKTIIPSPPL
jgi:hypothetical protein